MRLRDAIKLHNKDEIEVRTSPGIWEPAYIHNIIEYKDRAVICLQAKVSGYMQVNHTDIR
jgi:hypothetical protein